MRYKVGNTFYGKDWDQGFGHYGIPNMSWGKRRFQNKDGSLTPAGMKRYGVGDGQPNFGRNIQSEMQQRSIGAAISDSIRSKPARQREAYASRFANNSPAKPQYMIGSRPVDSIGKHIQQRKKQYENSPRGQAEAFLNKVGQGVYNTGNAIGQGVNNARQAVGEGVQTFKNKTGITALDNYNRAKANEEDARGRAVTAWENMINGPQENFQENFDKNRKAGYQLDSAAENRRHAEKAYNQSPLGRAEHFVRNAPGEIAEGVKNIPGQIKNIPGQIAQGAQRVGQSVSDALGFDDRERYQNYAGDVPRAKMDYDSEVRNVQRYGAALSDIDKANKEYGENWDRSPMAEGLDSARRSQSDAGRRLKNAMDNARSAKYMYDQTPLGRVENFANQVGQGAQNAWNSAANGIQQFGQNVGNFANQVGQNVGNFANQVGQNVGNFVDQVGYGARQLGGQIDRGLNLGIETGRILDAARGDQWRAQNRYDTARENYVQNTDASYPQRTEAFQNAAQNLVNAQKTLDSWEQQYGGTVIGGVRNAINQGQQILSDLLSRLFGR